MSEPRQRLERHDTLFIAPHGADIALACPARLLAESQSGRRTLVLALFDPPGSDTSAARAADDLGAAYTALGLQVARGRVGAAVPGEPLLDDASVVDAARRLAEVALDVKPLHVYAPLALAASSEHQVAHEAALRAFAGEVGRNLFLYEERPEAFVPGAVRTRLALMGARLPPGAAKAAERAGVLRQLWSATDPGRLRGEAGGFSQGLSVRADCLRKHRMAAAWNPLRALGPRLHPVVHVADEAARQRAQAVAHLLLPKDERGRSRAAEQFSARASALGKRLGGACHAERFWLVLPAHDGLPEIQHPLEAGAR